ncbi:MAG: hypothetical protein ACRD2X_26670 [Vicinamibacteraceae bacterium]
MNGILEFIGAGVLVYGGIYGIIVVSREVGSLVRQQFRQGADGHREIHAMPTGGKSHRAGGEIPASRALPSDTCAPSTT